MLSDGPNEKEAGQKEKRKLAQFHYLGLDECGGSREQVGSMSSIGLEMVKTICLSPLVKFADE